MKWLLCALVLLLLPVSASLASPPPDPAFSARVERLLQWIVDHSDFEMAGHQPAFVFMPTAEINYVLAGSDYDGGAPVVAAFIRAKAGILFLPDEGFADDILVHELVHFLQMTNGRESSCEGDLEREAYAIQEAFIAETGSGRPTNPVTRILATQCPAPWEQYRGR